MAINSMGLGRGLDSLIRETRAPRDAEGVQTLPLKDLYPNPGQPRRTFTEKALEELASSIKSQGLLQPILVRPFGDARPGKYEIVAGERRWRASRLAGLQEVPVLVRNFSAQDTLTAALIENLQREDLNPVEEALGIQTLKEEFGLSQEDLAVRLGKSRSAVANALRLLALPEVVRNDIADGRISAGHARALLSVSAPAAQEYLRNLIIEEHLSVRDAEGMASIWKATGKFRPDSPATTTSDNTGGTSADSAKNPATAGLQDLQGAQSAPEGTKPPLSDDPAVCAPLASSQKPTPQSARLLDLQSRICSAVSLPVRVTGKESKGKISFSYNSLEELNALLERLGLAPTSTAGGV